MFSRDALRIFLDGGTAMRLRSVTKTGGSHSFSMLNYFINIPSSNCVEIGEQFGLRVYFVFCLQALIKEREARAAVCIQWHLQL